VTATEWDDQFTATERHAIALTLRDLDGWGTLPSDLIRFDSATGEELPVAVKSIGDYDRTPRRGLPAGWIDLFIERGWVDLCPLLGGRSAWTPTDAGKAVRDAWLPEHLRGSE
jgi:hypothetical protein